MGTYVEIDGKLYVTKEDYLNIVKYYENSLSAERDGAKEEIKELKEKLEKLTVRIYENLPRDMWKEYKKFCEENYI